MKEIPLYKNDLESRAAVIELTPGLELNKECERCDLHTRAKNVCLPDTGLPGGILVVGEGPGHSEDSCGKPFVGTSGAHLRKVVNKYWSGPVAFANAIRCLPGKKPEPKYVDACRPYLAETLREVIPKRIIAVGAVAARSILGRAVAPYSTRKAYAWLYGVDVDPCPVFMVIHPAVALRNRFIRNWFEEDIEWALTSPLPSQPPYDATTLVIETVEDSEAAVKQLRQGGMVTFDTETSGRHHNDDFWVLCLSACRAGSDVVWTWPAPALNDPAVRAPLTALLENPNVQCCGQNLKYDTTTSRHGFETEVANQYFDTRLTRKLLDPEADGSLAVIAELIGMGGHKAETGEAIKLCMKAVQRKLKPLKKSKNEDLPDIPKHVESAIRLGADAKQYLYAFIPKDTLYRYCARDALSTSRSATLLQERLASEPELRAVWDKLLRPGMVAIDQVEEWGIAVDENALITFDKFLGTRLTTVTRQFAQYNINPASPKQVGELLFDKLGLPPMGTTKKGNKASTDKAALTAIKHLHPVVEEILEFRRLHKLKGTYAMGTKGEKEGMYKHIRDDGRIHPSFNLDGARTGRLSCLAGWVLVRTQRGDIPILQVREGDYVWTHKERWQRVTRFIAQGSQRVYDVQLGTGDVLSCASSHRVLLAAGVWSTVGELHECVEKLDDQQREHPSSHCLVSSDRATSDGKDNREEAWYYAAQHRARAPTKHAHGRADGFDAEVLSVKDRQQKSNEEQVWFFAPQLEGSLRGREGLLDLPARWPAKVRAPSSDGTGTRCRRSSIVSECSPHRRGPEEQRVEQSCAVHADWPCSRPLLAGAGHTVVSVEAIYDRGDCQVYDLSVEVDNSYWSSGVYSHNCNAPNLQNIPRSDSDEGQMARGIFVAPAGRKLVSADYSQLELRIAAMLSGDPKMKQIFLDGVDYHMRTAQLVSQLAWGIRPEDCEKKHRSAAKVINFGLLYGKTDRGLATDLGCSVEEVAKLRAAILGEFKLLAKWLRDQVNHATTHGFVWTWWDGQRARKRPLFDIASQDGKRQIHAINGAQNSPIQGTASDFCLASLAEAVKWIKDNVVPAKLVLTVHDSLIFEVDDDCVDELVVNINRIMRQWRSEIVPLVVDFEIGQSWGSLQSYEKYCAA